MKYDPTLPWRPVTGGGFNDHIGPIMFAQVGQDEYHFAVQLEDRHMNSTGVAHGGLMMSVVDTGMGTSAYTAAGQKPVATIDFECDFIAPGKNGQMLHGQATVVRKAREFLFMQGDLYADTRQVLRASGIWVIRSGGGQA